MKTALDHIVLNVRDIDVSISFYVNVVGFPAVRLDEYRSGNVPFPSVRINDQSLIDLFPPRMWDEGGSSGRGSGNLNHFCIALEPEDWNALRGRLEEHEITLVKDRTVNFGARGDGISMYFFDPDGNEIEARYYE